MLHNAILIKRNKIWRKFWIHFETYENHGPLFALKWPQLYSLNIAQWWETYYWIIIKNNLICQSIVLIFFHYKHVHVVIYPRKIRYLRPHGDGLDAHLTDWRSWGLYITQRRILYSKKRIWSTALSTEIHHLHAHKRQFHMKKYKPAHDNLVLIAYAQTVFNKRLCWRMQRC